MQYHYYAWPLPCGNISALWEELLSWVACTHHDRRCARYTSWWLTPPVSVQAPTQQYFPDEYATGYPHGILEGPSQS